MRKFVIFLSFILMLFVAVACDNNVYKQELKTSFGDEIIIEIYPSRTLHDEFWMCEITEKNSKIVTAFYLKEYITSNNISKEFQEIGSFNNTNVYKMFNEFIVIKEDDVGNFSQSYTIKEFENQINYNGINYEIVYDGMDVLCKTNKFLYIKTFSCFLDYFQNEYFYSLINKWAEGQFSQEDLSLNSEYTIEEISQWCNQFLGKTGDG